MNPDASGDRRRRWERLARLFSQSQQRQDLAVAGKTQMQRPLRAAAGFAPGWAGQNSPEPVAVLAEEA